MTGQDGYNLRLYVAGQTPKSIAAIGNLKKICEKHLPGRYHIEVVDLMKDPALAQRHQIVAIPTDDAFERFWQLADQRVVRRTRFAADRGADGILLGLPMWQPLTIDMAVEYYRSISEAFPRVALMVYGNGRAFRFSFPPEFWSRVVDVAPTLMAAKYSRPKALLDSLAASRGRVHFLPHDGGLSKFAELSPATTTACWSTAASMGPEPVLAQTRALLSNDAETLRRVAADLAWAREPIAEITSDPGLFATYNIQLEKIRIEAAGYCKAGPIRPPYNVMPESYAEGARENARRWRQLCEKYSNAFAR